jgi:hypothetical protein
LTREPRPPTQADLRLISRIQTRIRIRVKTCVQNTSNASSLARVPPARQTRSEPPRRSRNSISGGIRVRLAFPKSSARADPPSNKPPPTG